MFSLTCRLISLRSSIVRNPLLVLSYFLNIAPIYFFVQFKYGFVSIAFMNSMKLIPPAYQASNSATISQTVFLLGWNPFWVSKSFRSLGSKTPIPVESYASNTSFRSITSSIVRSPVTYNPGQNSRRSFLLNLTLYMSTLGRYGLPQLLSGEYPYFCELLLYFPLLSKDLVFYFLLILMDIALKFEDIIIGLEKQNLTVIRNQFANQKLEKSYICNFKAK